MESRPEKSYENKRPWLGQSPVRNHCEKSQFIASTPNCGAPDNGEFEHREGAVGLSNHGGSTGGDMDGISSVKCGTCNCWVDDIRKLSCGTCREVVIPC